MNGQQLLAANITATSNIIWHDGITLKQYKAANMKKSSNSVYAKVYAKIAEDDYYTIAAAITRMVTK